MRILVSVWPRVKVVISVYSVEKNYQAKMNFTSYIVIGLISLCSFLYWYVKKSFSYWKLRNVPYIEPTFPLGNFSGFKTNHPAQIVQNLYNQLKGKDKFGGIYLFTQPTALIIDLQLIKHILIKDFSNFDDRGFYFNEKDDPLSAHLFSLDNKDAKWKNLRTKLTPAFTSGKMKFMFPTIVEVGERLSECVKEKSGELEIKELLARYTTDVIGTCAFGIECNSLKDPNAEFRKMGRKIFGSPRHNNIVNLIIMSFKKTAKAFGIKVTRDDVSEFFMNAVSETVKYREENNISRNDFMDLLIKMKNQQNDQKLDNLTLNEIAAEAFLFFLAGFETSSTLLCFCLYELALNKDIQSKAREEIQRVMRKHYGKLTYEAMMDMPYVDQVLHGKLNYSTSIYIITIFSLLNSIFIERNIAKISSGRELDTRRQSRLPCARHGTCDRERNRNLDFNIWNSK